MSVLRMRTLCTGHACTETPGYEARPQLLQKLGNTWALGPGAASFLHGAVRARILASPTPGLEPWRVEAVQRASQSQDPGGAWACEPCGQEESQRRHWKRFVSAAKFRPGSVWTC